MSMVDCYRKERGYPQKEGFLNLKVGQRSTSQPLQHQLPP